MEVGCNSGAVAGGESRQGFELVRLQSGLWSLRKTSNGETFHPVVGPLNEARVLHVEQQRLLERAAGLGRALVVWDVGLGAAANALAVVSAFESHGAGLRVDLHSFDRDLGPLEFAIRHSLELGYLQGREGILGRLLEGATGGGNVQPLELGGVRWWFHLGDFSAMVRKASLPPPDGILYDPYSPASNPDMWCVDHFRALFSRLSGSRPCLWTNYTRSTSVRAGLLLAGFHVGIGRGVGEKEQTTVASNDPRLLEKPLGAVWLRRLRASTRGAPLRLLEDVQKRPGPIGPEDWAALIRHPQFAGLSGF
jgi:hypothetical protein